MTRLSILPHLIWEAALVVLVLIATVVGLTTKGMFSTSVPWAALLLLGTIALGLALSLRTGTPNLAVSGITALGGVVYGELMINDWPMLLALLVAVITCGVLGAIMAVITGLTGAPAWAVSLGGLALTQIAGYAINSEPQRIPAAGHLGAVAVDIGCALVLLASIAGGALFLLPAVRRALSVPDAGSPDQPLIARLLRAGVGLIGSSLLAGLGGALYAGAVFYIQPFGYNNQILLALGVVLLGGVSAYGRGGGIAGTALALYVVVMAQNYAFIHAPTWVNGALLPALVLLLGVLVSWLLERLSARRGGPGPAGAQPAGWPSGAGPAPQPVLAGAAPFGPPYGAPPYGPPPTSAPPSSAPPSSAPPTSAPPTSAPPQPGWSQPGSPQSGWPSTPPPAYPPPAYPPPGQPYPPYQGGYPPPPGGEQPPPRF